MTDVESTTQAETTQPRPTFRAALAHRDFALVWSGQTFSAVGNQVFPLALAVFVLAGGGGASALGAVLGAMTAAVIAGTLTAAALGDRWRRTRVMIAADAVRAVAVGAIALSPVDAGMPFLIVAVAIVGFGEGLFAPAFGAAIPRFLPRDLLAPGNGLNSLSMYLSMMIGPALAGLLTAAWDPRIALWLDAATFVVSIATLLAVREARPEREESDGPAAGPIKAMVDDLRGGIGAVVARPWIGASIGMATVVMTFVTAPALVLLPVIADERLGGPGAYSWTLVVMGIGCAMGAMIASRIRVRRQGLFALCCVASNAACVLGLAFLPLPGVLATFWLAGLGVIIFQVIWTTALQKDVPDHVMARVMALDWLGSQALMPIGYALTGPLALMFGQNVLLVAGAVLMLVVVPLPLLTRGGATFSSDDTSRPLLALPTRRGQRA